MSYPNSDIQYGTQQVGKGNTRYAALVCALLGAGLNVGPSLAQDGDRGGQRSQGPIVSTVEGPVQEYTRNGVDVFLGIPYAGPPIGDFRWQPPQPVKSWRDTRDSTHYASSCPQVTTLGVFAGPTSVNEDCLYLNVFTKGNAPPGHKKPVIVWFHGGGNIDGESNDYDGTKLAMGGPGGVESVVVTLNYRLGVLGIFSHPAINSEGHQWGNYSTHDQQAALRWVQHNIQCFGGDPSKVAIGGQSAGAINVGVNLISPLSKGLFSRAILQSSPAGDCLGSYGRDHTESWRKFRQGRRVSGVRCGNSQMPAQSFRGPHHAVARNEQGQWSLCYGCSVCGRHYRPVAA